MSDGLLVPGLHDGMGAFPGPDGTTILVRNHELETSHVALGAFGPRRMGLRKIDRSLLYDAGRGRIPGLGGVTTLVYDTARKRLLSHRLSLAGTYRNCAGGVTPWGSWITCEEAVDKPGDDERDPSDIEQPHGYNFEVPARADGGLVVPVPLKAMGRFRHEAIAVDPRTGIVYQTEDREDGLFYRYIPNTRGRLAEGGRLQALRVRDMRRCDTRNWHSRTIAQNTPLPVEWADLADVDPVDDDLRYHGYFERGAARFARGEGAWHGRDAVYFACTSGGRKRRGQIFRYLPSPDEGGAGEVKAPGRLELFVEPDNGNLVDNCDNGCVAPWGDLIVCEDGSSPQHVVGVTPEGGIYKLARTTISELAGPCFSPDGSTLFVNIQNPGVTVAITGPWDQLRSITPPV
jgi:secreted PhoX family phosphatase